MDFASGKNLLVLLWVVIFCTGCKLEPEADFKITTQYGDIYVRLYEDTPKHTDNFKQLVAGKKLNGYTFHRIIEDFMIQGGRPAIDTLPDGSDAHAIPSEISDLHYHKAGAFAAARRDDSVNVERKSASTQFYIITGKVYTDSELTEIEQTTRKAVPSFKFTDEQRKTYTTVGGAPALDGQYTVFGEVVAGLEIARRISKMATGSNDRPLKQVSFKIVQL